MYANIKLEVQDTAFLFIVLAVSLYIHLEIKGFAMYCTRKKKLDWLEKKWLGEKG